MFQNQHVEFILRLKIQLFFLSWSGFCFTNIRIYRTTRERGRYSLTPLYHFHPLQDWNVEYFIFQGGKKITILFLKTVIKWCRWTRLGPHLQIVFRSSKDIYENQETFSLGDNKKEALVSEETDENILKNSNYFLPTIKECLNIKWNAEILFLIMLTD